LFYWQLSEATLPIDSRVSQKLTELAQMGIRRLPEVCRQLSQFITEELFAGKQPPASTDTRYWPTSKQIIACLCRTKQKLRYSTSLKVVIC